MGASAASVTASLLVVLLPILLVVLRIINLNLLRSEK